MMRDLIHAASWLGVCITLGLFGLSCRDKNTGTGPDNPMPGDWSIVLRHSLKLHAGGSDTITVRVYDPQGDVAGSVNVHSVASSGSGAVPPDVTTVADTAARPWGTNLPVTYSGDGLPNGSDTVWCYARQLGNFDTLAFTKTWFEVIE